MVSKVNGGVGIGTNLAGHLAYYKIVATGATFLNEFNKVIDPDTTGPLAPSLVAVPNSALEEVYKQISLRSTVVIFEVENDTTVHVAVENAGDGWNDLQPLVASADADELDAALTAALPIRDALVTGVVVTKGAFRVA
jgi:hypothetical protein